MNREADGVIGFYRRHARRWSAARGTRPAEGDWIDRFVTLLAPATRVLDIGCGSGLPIARALTDRGYDVTGIDAAPEMIALFRANLPDSAAAVADMRSLALDERFGGVIAWDSLFHLAHADQRRMIAILAAHARPGAPVIFTSGPAHGEAIGDLFGEALHHASLAPDEYRRLLDAAGLDLVAHVAADPSCDRTVWLARRR